jgi:hypothetical protein
MSLERRSPLPVGLYWIDLFGDNRAAFQTWRNANAAAVKVRASESFPEESTPRDWIKFEVLQPAAWVATQFGYPTIIAAGAPVNSSADTVQRPDPEKDLPDKLDDAITSAASAGGRLVEVVALAAGALFLVNLWSRSRGR